MRLRTHRPHITLNIALLALACLTLTGCSSGRPFELWEQHVNTYVADYGNGDLMCLRTTDPETARPTFGAEKGSTLVQGVLVGCEDTGAHVWWVYIVGASRDEQVREVKLMAVTASDDGLIFASSENDTDATKRYLDRRRDQSNAYRNDQSSEMDVFGLFPGHTDSFTLVMTGEVATVTESNSGATWTAVLSDAPKVAQR